MKCCPAAVFALFRTFRARSLLIRGSRRGAAKLAALRGLEGLYGLYRGRGGGQIHHAPHVTGTSFITGKTSRKRSTGVDPQAHDSFTSAIRVSVSPLGGALRGLQRPLSDNLGQLEACGDIQGPGHSRRTRQGQQLVVAPARAGARFCRGCQMPSSRIHFTQRDEKSVTQ